jgi:hypothetical protein
VVSELQDFLEEAQPGPWRPEPPHDEFGTAQRPLWLTNDAGDSLIVEPETAALLVNAAISRVNP